jgi:hypothetical protein
MPTSPSGHTASQTMTMRANPEPAVADTIIDREPTERPARRGVRLAVVAIALSLGVAAVQVATDATADGPAPLDCTSSAQADDSFCDGLWGRVRALGLPEDEWTAAAEAMGLFPRGEWISDDGLRWEHLDGRTHVVATPRPSDGSTTDGS